KDSKLLQRLGVVVDYLDAGSLWAGLSHLFVVTNFGPDLELVEISAEYGVAMKVQFSALGSCQETVSTLAEDFRNPRDRLIVPFRFTLHPMRMILQLSAGSIERIKQRGFKIFRGTIADGEFSSFHLQIDAHGERAAPLMMPDRPGR